MTDDSLSLTEEVRQLSTAPQVEFSHSNSYVRGTLCFLSQVEWTASGPDSKEGRISLQWLKFRLVFHLKRWRDVWIPVEMLEKAVGLRLIWTGGITSIWHPRGTWNSILQKVMMPDYFWKWIGIPMSLFQLESDRRSPASPPEGSVLSCQS